MLSVIHDTTLDHTESGPAGGPPVVLIHGFPFSQEMWTPQIGALSLRYRVITYDVRGHGKSPPGDGQYTLEFFVDDLIGLLDHLRIDRAVLCGLSMGGYIALRAVERNPERVRALVLCDTRSEADSNEAKVKRAGAINAVKRQGVSAYAEGFVKAVFAPESFTTRPEAIEKIKKIIQANPASGICGTLLALACRTDTTAALPKIGVPTLILVGDQDSLTPPSAAEAMRGKIPRSEMHVIPHAAHMSNLENPGEFNARLLDFLGRV
jgi:3-oxoadipate enol-lactonase